MELCKWTVDLGNLPSFEQQANIAQGGFYTGEFVSAVVIDYLLSSASVALT